MRLNDLAGRLVEDLSYWHDRLHFYNDQTYTEKQTVVEQLDKLIFLAADIARAIDEETYRGHDEDYP